GRRDADDALAEEVEREERLLRARLHDEEEGEAGERGGDERRRARARPRREERADDAAGEEERAREVEAVLVALDALVVGGGEHRGAAEAERQVHVEHPAP